MSGMFGMFAKKKSPEQVVAALKTDLEELVVTSTHLDKVNADIEKRVDQIKAVIYGEPSEKEDSPSSAGAAVPDPAAIEAIAEAFKTCEIMPLALSHLKLVGFEIRKSFVALFVYLLRHDCAGFASVYMPSHINLLFTLVDGYNSADIALNCGTMLRECIKVPALHEALLYGMDGGLSQPLCDLFENHVINPSFEVASDAFETLSVILMSNKPLVFKCLNPNGDAASLARYHQFFAMYNKMLQSDNYVLKRQSLKLLSEFLLDRENFGIMMKYIVEFSNLKIIMTLLRHNQPNIQFEAFHVFKVFVANPDKPEDVQRVLAMNKVRLINFLRGFQNEKDDEQFMEEKAMLIDTLMKLPDVPTHEHTSSS